MNEPKRKEVGSAREEKQPVAKSKNIFGQTMAYQNGAIRYKN